MTNPDSKLPDAGLEQPDFKVEWGDLSRQVFPQETLDLMTSIIYSSKIKSTLDFKNYFWEEPQCKVQIILKKMTEDIFKYLFKKQIKNKGAKIKTRIRIKKDIGLFISQMYNDLIPHFSKNNNLKKVFSEFTRSISAYLVAILVKWKYSKLSEDRNAQNFYTVAENENSLEKYQETEAGYLLEIYHHFLRLEKFLKQCPVEIPLKEGKLKEINQKLAELIKKEQIRGIPMVISQNETFSKTPIWVQINDIPQSASIFNTALAHINLYGPKTSSLVINDLNFLNQLGTCIPFPSKDQTLFMEIKGGDMGVFKVQKKSMEIETPCINTQSLKFFLRQQGDTDDSVYEAIRFNILLKIAEMTVDQAKLMEVLDGIIEFPQPAFPEEKVAGPSNPSKPQEQDETQQKIPSRYYPRMLLHRPKTAEKEDEFEKRKIILNHRVYHRRLLPVGDRPSQQAQELAQGKVALGIAVQMPDFVVIKPDMLKTEAEQRGTNEEQCVHDLVALGGEIRYYTFVREFKRAETKPMVEGHFRSKVVGVPDAELEGGIEETRESVENLEVSDFKKC